MRLSVSIYLIAGMAMCGCTMAGADQKPYLNHRLWLDQAETLCPQLGSRENCQDVRSGSFVADSVTKRFNVDYCHVKFDDGKEGYMLCSTAEFSPREDPDIARRQATADCKRRGQPRIGMSVVQATASCWGKPENVNRTTGANGTRDQFVYDGGRYLYFENGILRSIQERGTLSQ